MEGADSSSFQQFLVQFLNDNDANKDTENSSPLRLNNYYLTPGEVEGECLDITLQYLHTHKCPSLLASYIARAVTNNVLKLDYKQFEEENISDTITSQDHVGDYEGTLSESAKEDCQLDDMTSASRSPVLLVSKLSSVVLSQIHEVCEKWKSEFPKSLVRAKKHPLMVSSHCMKNSRRKMEDRHIILSHYSELFDLEAVASDASYYSVFDGHGGVDAAIYANCHLHCNIARHPAFPKDIPLAMKDAYKKTDEDFMQKAVKESLRSGSTGVTAIVHDNMLHISWLGDSQMMLVREGDPVQLMTAHKPERTDEKARIEALGGCVVWFGAWRVNGNLSVSRAIGDADFKPFVSGDADVASFEMTGNEDYFILGCDGLWDTLSPEDVANSVYEYLQENKEDWDGVAPMLVRLARDRGSTDNISVIVVFCRSVIAPPASKRAFKIVEANEEGDSAEEEEKKDSSEKDGASGNDDTVDKEESGSSEGDDKGAGMGKKSSSKVDSSDHPMVYKMRRSHEMHCLSEAAGSHANLLAENGRLKDIESPQGQDCARTSSVADTVSSSNASVVSHGESQTGSQHVSSHKSSGSHGELAIMSKTATRCLSYRKGKRSKNGRNGNRRNTKENRRSSRDTTGSGVAHRTNGERVAVFRSRSASDTKLRNRALQHSQESLHPNPSHLFRMLTGCNPQTVFRAKNPGRWTVAVEIESGSAMFEEKPFDKKSKRNSFY